jgi:hypothetical protein
MVIKALFKNQWFKYHKEQDLDRKRANGQTTIYKTLHIKHYTGN